MTKVRSNVEGFVEAIKRSDSGLTVKVMTNNGEFHEYGNLSRVLVDEFEIVNIGDPIGECNGSLHYSVKV